MLKIECLSTGSRGNCYLLSNSNNEIIILDCGIKFTDLLKAIKGRVGNIVGCICTHSHQDHKLCLDDIKRSGIPTIYFTSISQKLPLNLGSYTIYPIAVKHNVVNHAFVIKNKIDKKTITYATDLSFLPKIKNVDVWILEANYDEQILNKRINLLGDDIEHITMGSKNHLSVQQVHEYFNNEIIKKPEKVLLVHQSKEYINKDSYNILDNINYEIAKKGDTYEI